MWLFQIMRLNDGVSKTEQRSHVKIAFICDRNDHMCYAELQKEVAISNYCEMDGIVQMWTYSNC